MNTDQAGRKLEQQLLLGRRIEGDRLMLSDATLLAALDGRRALTAAEKAALQASPLTLRRLRTLSLARIDAWHGSTGMLRAAAGHAPLTALATDDGHWVLHFLQQDGHWRVILALDAGAPFAARLLREQGLLCVRDGAGATILQGRLDADGECEGRWPFALAPGPHFQQAGATFAVQPVLP